MIRALYGRGCGPIGVDVGSRSTKLLQFSADHSEIIDVARADLPLLDAVDSAEHDESSDEAASPNDLFDEALAEAIRRARQMRNFRGREAVLCLGEPSLFVQNIRVPKTAGSELDQIVRYEATGRLPFDAEDAEIRFLEAADVRQGDVAKREVILLASPRPVIHRLIKTVERAGLRPVAIDAEPVALLRCYKRQFRRDSDREQRMMFVHIGSSKTLIVIAQGDTALFVKYVRLGGQQFDEAVANHLQLSVSDAAALRRHTADRESDPEVSRDIAHALRGVVSRLGDELSMCIRYHSVAFRGQPLQHILIGGGEADEALVAALQETLDPPCELANPFRSIPNRPTVGRAGQWAIATGLALRN